MLVSSDALSSDGRGTDTQMNDPHVEALMYDLVPAPGLAFQPSANPIEFEADAFRARLADGALRLEMIEHFAREDDARRAVEPFLRAWEIFGSLPIGYAFHFAFAGAVVIDRAGRGLGTDRALSLRETVQLRAEVTFQRSQYPAPPLGLAVNPLVETLWTRYRASLENREPLQSMAYACLTALESEGGGRTKAAALFGISVEVLGKLGELTSARDSGAELSRKIRPGNAALTPAEAAWLKKAIRTIIAHLMSPPAMRVPLTIDSLPPV